MPDCYTCPILALLQLLHLFSLNQRSVLVTSRPIFGDRHDLKYLWDSLHFIDHYEPPKGYSDEVKRECLAMCVNRMGYGALNELKGYITLP
jgi:hypothetical protein